MKKNNKGITLIMVVTTVILLTILTAVVITSTETGSDYKKYKNMCSDVDLLENKILLFYNKYGQLPSTALTAEEISAIPAGLSGMVNTANMEKIDASKLNGVSLNYGDEEDIFLVDNTTFKVYYENGIEYKGVMYYTD